MNGWSFFPGVTSSPVIALSSLSTSPSILVFLMFPEILHADAQLNQAAIRVVEATSGLL